MTAMPPATAAHATQVSLTAVPGLPDVRAGDDLTALLADALAPLAPRPGDVIALAHKVVSKAEGCVIRLTDVTPSDKATRLGRDLAKDPRKVEVILGQSKSVLRSFKHPGQGEGTLICEHRLGFISANAGVDASNLGDDDAVLTLPPDPDASARRLRAGLEARFAAPIAVVITDTFGRPWRLGQVNVAIGLAGLPARMREPGEVDAWGRPLAVTEPALADEVAAAAGLVMRKAARTPAILVRGLAWAPTPDTRAAQLLRLPKEDMFR
ncbi:MAG: coenzyme F420-0:L-glutamate ligase [Pseudomonadota bacterium]